MQFTLRQFETLVSVAEHGSFTQAAEALGVSQPSVSETVARIEAELGFAVFLRSTRRLSLSPDGRHVIASARELLRAVHFAHQALGARLGAETSQIALAALPSVLAGLLPPILRAFHAAHPEVHVSVYDTNQERAIKLVHEGMVDFAFVGLGAFPSDLRYAPLAEDRMFLVCADTHPLARQEKVDWCAVAEQRFIAIAPGSSVRKATDAAFLQAGVSCLPHYEVEQVPSAAALASAGLGVTILPELSFTLFPQSGLVQRPMAAPEILRQIGVLTRRSKELAPSATRFLEICRDGVTRQP